MTVYRILNNNFTDFLKSFAQQSLIFLLITTACSLILNITLYSNSETAFEYLIIHIIFFSILCVLMLLVKKDYIHLTFTGMLLTLFLVMAVTQYYDGSNEWTAPVVGILISAISPLFLNKKGQFITYLLILATYIGIGISLEEIAIVEERVVYIVLFPFFLSFIVNRLTDLYLNQT